MENQENLSQQRGAVWVVLSIAGSSFALLPSSLCSIFQSYIFSLQGFRFGNQSCVECWWFIYKNRSSTCQAQQGLGEKRDANAGAACDPYRAEMPLLYKIIAKHFQRQIVSRPGLCSQTHLTLRRNATLSCSNTTVLKRELWGQ